jgi:peptidoglycan/LPS O-acetylase OafA/YrhL
LLNPGILKSSLQGEAILKNSHFAVLDGLRGVAALVVLVLHLGQQCNNPGPSCAHLVVDFFFILSGFVIAFAYEEQLTSGKLRLQAFARIRLVRLYPLFLIGALGSIAISAFNFLTKGTATPTELLIAAFSNLLFLPTIAIASDASAYPFNTPSWSLAFELFINAVYAIIARWLTTSRLIAILLLSALAAIWLAEASGTTDGGHDKVTVSFGFVRVCYPFFAGVLLYRFRPERSHKPLLATLLLVGLFLVLLGNWPHPILSSLFLVLVGFPLLIWLASACNVSGRLAVMCALLGDLSYPVYVLQSFVLRIGETVMRNRILSNAQIQAFVAAEALAVIAFSWLALRYFDIPVRQFLDARKGAERKTVLVTPHLAATTGPADA